MNATIEAVTGARCEGSRILRRQPAQGVCRWCTRALLATRGQPCAIDEETRKKLRSFATCYGRTWRAALRRAWENVADEPWMRVVRNVVGPSGLARVIVDDAMIKPAKVR